MGSMHISRVGHLPFRKFPDMGRVFMDAFAWERHTLHFWDVCKLT